MGEFEKDLIDGCRRGEHRAWATLVERVSPLIFATCRSYRIDAQTAEDVAQTVLTALLKSLDNVREPGAIWGWISTSTARECTRVIRQTARSSQVAANAAAEAGAPSIPDVDHLEELARVRAAVTELGGRCRELLELLYLRTQQSDYETIADELKIPIGSIGPTRQRCLSKLLALLEPPPMP